VDRLTELVKIFRESTVGIGNWNSMRPLTDQEKAIARVCADELEAALAAELSDAKKRETSFEAQGKQPATPSAREFAEVLGLTPTEQLQVAQSIPTWLRQKISTAILDIRAEALREAAALANEHEIIWAEDVLALIPARPENAKPAGT
jgi:hypothetical protein